jgi:hypothetical protein
MGDTRGKTLPYPHECNDCEMCHSAPPTCTWLTETLQRWSR